MSGRKIFSSKWNATQKTHQLNLPELAAGIYICEMRIGGEMYQQKLVIVR